MYTLIAFATEWGSKYGGINSFNADFLTAFGAAYHHGAQIVCIVSQHSAEAFDEAAKAHIRLVALPYVPKERSFDASIGETGVELLRKANVTFDSATTMWLGHDLITGEAAVAAARVAGGRSAVIHHMSYDDYESYAEDTESAQYKTTKQTAILKQADLVLAIGPLLRDAARDRIGASKSVHMLVPGLPEIDPREAPNKFVAFLSGRLTPDAARIKQSHLGIAAFATAELQARRDGVPEALKRQPKLLLRGVDFENRIVPVNLTITHDPEAELKDFADQYANGVVNLHALPYTEDRQQIYSELSGSSVALMTSWHEGFGLVAWEAIAAGVPLILGENTGVYRFLDEEYSGAQIGYVHALDVSGQRDFPYFRLEDLDKTIKALRFVALDPAKARIRASQLRNHLLDKYSWPNCSEKTAEAFGWALQKGSLPDRAADIVEGITQHTEAATATVGIEPGPLTIPRGQWRAAAGMADSQLLRAEEELLPFDPRRQPQIDALRKWADDPAWPVMVRLITADGGQGKTRLAIEACQQLRANGWHAGFLDSSVEANRMSSLWRELNGLNRPVLIVVDYAETRQEAFLSLLQAALQTTPNKPVRMLLLARNGGEWWDNLPSTNSSCEPLLNGPATTGPFPLPPLYVEQEDRQQAFADALNAFATVLKVPNPGIVSQLVGEQFERPLFVQMAALLALYGERPTTIQGLTKALLSHERRYWVRLLAPFNWPDPGRRAEQLLALSTLAGGFPIARTAETFWREAKGTVLTSGEFNALFRNLSALYPGTQGLQALRPDLLGEALVAQALLRPDGESLLDAVLSSSAIQQVRRNALTVLGRMSNERADVYEILVTVLCRRFENCAAELVAVSTETESRLPEAAVVAFERLSSAKKNQLAGALKQSLPYESVHLAELTCVVFSHLVDSTRHKFEAKPNAVDRLAEYTKALDRYGASLFHAGKYELSHKVSYDALQMTRKLVARDRNRYEAFHAVLLSNYLANLLESGTDKNAEDAIAYAREALDIRERLATKDPHRFEASYARALANYASALCHIGKLKQGLQPAEQAVKIYKKLINANRVELEGDYADALHIYSLNLSSVGKVDKALPHSQKAVDIWKQLKERNPDRFQPSYAKSLANYCVLLCEAGRFTEGLRHGHEAYVIAEHLATKQPRRFAIQLVDVETFLCFVYWLSNNEFSGNKQFRSRMLPLVPGHEQLLMQMFLDFVNACLTHDYEARADGFRRVLSSWPRLSQPQKEIAEGQRFCAAAWSSKYDCLSARVWDGDWREYLQKRNGNVPVWMMEVARRLEFEFPNAHLIVSERADGIDPCRARGGIKGGDDRDDQGEGDGAER